MKRSALLCRTNKQDLTKAETISHRLLLKADFIDQLASGIYSFLPLGWRVRQNISQIIREEFNRIGGEEILMPSLQPKSLWEESGRWETMDPPLFVLKDCHQRLMCLAPTHEEAVTNLIRHRLSSYKDFPIALYQLQTKFRNETRATGGLLRTREFLMADLYSFHQDKEDLGHFYKTVQKAYEEIFKRLNLEIKWVPASSGTIGGSVSHEAVVLAESGEDKVLVCPACGTVLSGEKNVKTCPHCQHKLEEQRAIEVGHVFQLGAKYSRALKARFTDGQGKPQAVEMGCYGLGVGRIMATLVEKHHDQQGMIWPRSVAPYSFYLIGAGNDHEVEQSVNSVYNELQDKGWEILWDDRKGKSIGEKFADADLLGIPYRLVISPKTLAQEAIEIKERLSGQIQIIKLKELEKFLEKNV